MRALRWALVATVAWGVLAFGAVYPWAYWPLLAASAGVGLWASTSSHAWRDPRAMRLGQALTAVVVALVVQAFPWPYQWVKWVSPGVDSFLRQSSLGYQAPEGHSLSLDPAATVVTLFFTVGLGLLLVGATRTVRSMNLEWLVSQLMGLAVALAVVGVVARAFFDPADPLVYGFWRPRHGGNPFGPFVNRNHFAGWMVMVLPMVAMYAVGVLSEARRPVGRGAASWLRWLATTDGNRVLLIVVATLIMGTALLLTGSRSGVASCLVSTVVMLLFIRQQVRDRRYRLAALLYLGVVLTGAVAWGGSDVIVARFADAPGAFEGRLGAWRDTLHIIRDFPVFGVGLGAYARAMVLYQTGPRQLMFAQAHNDYLQLAAEGGLLVGVPAVILFIVVVLSVRRRLKSSDDDAVTFWIRRGAVAGLVGIAAQSLMEFSLQMPGNAVLFVILLAIAMHRPRSLHHAHRV